MEYNMSHRRTCQHPSTDEQGFPDKGFRPLNKAGQRSREEQRSDQLTGRTFVWWIQLSVTSWPIILNIKKGIEKKTLSSDRAIFQRE